VFNLAIPPDELFRNYLNGDYQQGNNLGELARDLDRRDRRDSISGGKERMKKFLKYSIIAGGIIGAFFIILAFLFGPHYITYYTRSFLTIACLVWLLIFMILAIIWLGRLISGWGDQN
jgi:VIT1/CCC1 family predicted Fe2+/Mn2+ transporter